MPLRNPFASHGVDDPPSPVIASQLPMYLAWAVGGFLRSWFQTRNLLRLVQGLPALFLAGVLTWLLISSDQPVSPETVHGYLVQAQQAASREDFDEAEFYFRKLEQLAPQDRKVIYEHALMHDMQENYGEAFRLMESLVRDDDRSNDVDVHLWLAKTALNKDVGLESPLDYAKAHLVAVLEDDPKDLYAQYFFARLYLRQGDIASAIDHLQVVANYSPDLQLLLASLYLRTNPPAQDRSQSAALAAVDTLKEKIQKTQSADVETYHQLATGYLLLKRFDDAVQTLRQAVTKFNLDPSRRMLARTFAAWSDEVARQEPENVGKRMKLLEQGLEWAPNEPLVLNRILEMASAEGPGAEVAEQRLRKALVDGVAPAIVHFSLGSLAAKRGDSETAMRHFKQSAHLNPHTAVTLNNIAYLMTQTEGADLEQALELVNQALEMAPAAAPFRDTRGQILVRLERWSDAIADLEYANTRMTELSSRIAINQSLALAYDKLGDAELSKVYHQRYEELLSEAKAKNQSAATGIPDVNFEKPEVETESDAIPAE